MPSETAFFYFSFTVLPHGLCHAIPKVVLFQRLK